MPLTQDSMRSNTVDAPPDSPMDDTMKFEHMKSGETEQPAGHMMSMSDPDNPQNWPLHRKLYVSAVAFAFAFVV